LLFALLVVSPARAAVSFAPAVSYRVGDATHGMASADFNQDGNRDLVVVNRHGFSVLSGRDDGTFASQVNYGLGSSEFPHAVATGDFNRDGDPDLVITNASRFVNSQSWVVLGGAKASFGPPATIPVGLSQSVVVGNFDTDDNPDLAVATIYGDNGSGTAGGGVVVLAGNGDGTFAPPTLNLVHGGSPTYVVGTGDFNGDDDPDLAAVSGYDDVTILVGAADDTFNRRDTTYPTPVEPEPDAIGVSDFDGDSDPDLAVPDPLGFEGRVWVLRGLEGPTFAPAASYGEAEGNYPTSVAVADFNADGDQDLASASLDHLATVLTGGPGVSFGDSQRFAIGSAGTSDVARDFNHDGYPDLVVAAGGAVAVFLNRPVGPYPDPVAFPATVVSHESPAQTVVLTNNRSTSLSVGGIALTGADAAQFAAVGDGCSGATVPPGGTCSVQLRFRPANTGAYSARLEFVDDGPGSPQSAALTGTGVTPVGFNPTAVAFGSTVWGLQSAPRTVTVTNNGTRGLSISSTAVVGADPSVFTTSNDTCRRQTIAPGASCGIAVTFRPGGLGPRSASLQLNDDAADSPQLVPLSGTGVSPAGLPTSATFQKRPEHTVSGAKTVTLTNRGTANLAVDSVALTGADADDFRAGSDTCTGATLAGGQSCSVQVRFAPLSPGFKTAGLRFTDSAPDGAQTVALSGAAFASPALALSPTSLKLGHVPVGTTSAAKTVTLTNIGSLQMTIWSILVEGANASDFTGLTQNCTGALGPGQSCTASVAFQPTATGTRTATLTIQDSAPGSPHHLRLQGTGT
jgi:FG-GAP-like repeat/Abnormal spindle-like microcephaly-assoc'd, ASPM-SPD-2-Hydin/FG-GAP repeat